MSFIFTDFPPISGIQRAVFYLGLLALCLYDSPTPFDSPSIMRRTVELFYTPPKLLRLFGFGMPNLTTLKFVRALTIFFWISAAAGLFQPISSVLTFLCFAFLHAVNSGALGSNHSTHSVLYALFALCFSVSNDGFSLDYLLKENFLWPQLYPSGSVLESGFALKFLQITMVYIMFAGGLSKLRYGGIQWFSGQSLHFYIEQHKTAARSPLISRILRSNPRLCSLLATISVIVEISGVITLFNVQLMPYVVLAWCCFHIGILLVMMPDYWIHMWCYTLLINWNGLMGNKNPPSWSSADGEGSFASILIAFFLAYCLMLLVVWLRHVEEWPFTAVPMYSNGVIPSKRKLPAISELNAKAVAASNGKITEWHRSWAYGEMNEDIMIVPAFGGSARPLIEVLYENAITFTRWSQWTKVVRGVTIKDIAVKPPDCPGKAGAYFPATKFLQQLATLLKERLPVSKDYERLELICKTSEGPLVIGSASLNNNTLTYDEKR